MKFYLSSIGTTGDIIPFQFLAEELVRNGHKVSMNSHNIHKSHFESLNIPFFIPDSPISNDELNNSFNNIYESHSIFSQIDTVCHDMVFRDFKQRYKFALENGNDSHVFITHIADHAAQAAALMLNKKLIIVRFETMSIPTQFHMPPPIYCNFGKVINSFSWKLADLILSKYDNLLSKILKDLKYNKKDISIIREQSENLNLCACSSLLAPPYQDFHKNFITTGQWHSINKVSNLPEEISNFVKKFENKFLFITLGSMKQINENNTVQCFVETVKEFDIPAIIQIKGSDKIKSPIESNIIFCDFLNHDDIFPSAKAVIHHGGSGTSHSVVRAGIPCICIPHILDQFYFSSNLQKLGISAATINIKKLNKKKLKRSLRKLTTNFVQYKNNAKKAQEIISKDKGIKYAVELIISNYIHPTKDITS